MYVLFQKIYHSDIHLFYLKLMTTNINNVQSIQGFLPGFTSAAYLIGLGVVHVR